MNKFQNISNIEGFFREKFGDYKVNPSAGLWNKIYRKLIWKEFLTFNLTSFNGYYLTGILALSIAGILWITNPKAGINPEKLQDVVTVREDQGESRELITTDMPSESQPTEDLSEQRDVTALEEKSTDLTETKTADKLGLENKEVSTSDEKDFSKTVLTHEKEQQKKETSNIKQPGTLNFEPGTSPPPPTADYTSSAKSGCGSLTVLFENRSLHANTYIWYFGDGGTSGEENPTYIYDRSGEYIVSLTAIGEGGESVVTKDTVRVYDLPEAVFEFKPENAVLPDDPVIFYNYSQNAVQCLWDFGDNRSSVEAEPVHYYSKAGEYNVKLKVWSQEGCTDSVVIFDAFADDGCQILFPNAFTPNPNGPGSGYYSPGSTDNDVFFPIYRGVVEYRLRIFNRFGKLIFESTDISIGWDGYINSKLAKQDVYIWKVRGRFQNGKSFVRFGNVTLLVKN